MGQCGAGARDGFDLATVLFSFPLFLRGFSNFRSRKGHCSHPQPEAIEALAPSPDRLISQIVRRIQRFALQAAPMK